MSDLEVNSASVSTLSGSLSGVHAGLAAKLDGLHTSVNALEGGWRGAAQQAFLSRYSAFRTESAHLSEVLGSAAQAAMEISESYRSADERVGDLWKL